MKNAICKNALDGCSPIIVIFIFILSICMFTLFSFFNISTVAATQEETVICQGYLSKALTSTKDNKWIRKPSGKLQSEK
jgi:hypothetical protein